MLDIDNMDSICAIAAIIRETPCKPKSKKNLSLENAPIADASLLASILSKIIPVKESDHGRVCNNNRKYRDRLNVVRHRNA